MSDKDGILVVTRPILGKDINFIPPLTPPPGHVNTKVVKSKPPVNVRKGSKSKRM